jgi:hypothetical protein
MSPHETRGATHPNRTSQRIGVALVISLGFVASACASPPNPCGISLPASADQHIGMFRDPYTQRKQLVRYVEAYRIAAGRTNDDGSVRAAQWRVCVSAQGLAPYTREVAPDIRPRFTSALTILVSKTRSQSEVSEAGAGADVSQAIDEFLLAMPRFWQSPAASLRGARQPGSPLHTHY